VSHIHFVGGEKGGVGKSVVARVLSQRLIDQGLPFAAIDADTSHGTLARSYGSYTQKVDLEELSSADEIMNRALGDERRVIVDLPAQSMKHLQHWFDSADIVRFAAELGLRITLWHVTDGGFDSISDLQRMLESFGSPFSYIIVKNRGRSSNFSQLESANIVAQFETLGAKVIELPELEPTVMYKIDRQGLSFWAAVNNSEGEFTLTPMERQRVRSWLNRCTDQIDSLAEAF
jgi:hypothetical protein